MSEQKDGGPAFPVSTARAEDGSFGHQDGNYPWQFGGVTMRDYFAGQAVSGCIATCQGDTRLPGESKADLIARRAYELADAMLTAREST
jgi:hypothetical protein